MNDPRTPESPFLIERLMRETARQFEKEDYASENDFSLIIALDLSAEYEYETWLRLIMALKNRCRP